MVLLFVMLFAEFSTKFPCSTFIPPLVITSFFVFWNQDHLFVWAYCNLASQQIMPTPQLLPTRRRRKTFLIKY
jgi:hypothetical protein